MNYEYSDHLVSRETREKKDNFFFAFKQHSCYSRKQKNKSVSFHLFFLPQSDIYNSFVQTTE